MCIRDRSHPRWRAGRSSAAPHGHTLSAGETSRPVIGCYKRHMVRHLLGSEAIHRLPVLGVPKCARRDGLGLPARKQRGPVHARQQSRRRRNRPD
eukprot:7471793-Pyramimonas_sp.AAC.1